MLNSIIGFFKKKSATGDSLDVHAFNSLICPLITIFGDEIRVDKHATVKVGGTMRGGLFEASHSNIVLDHGGALRYEEIFAHHAALSGNVECKVLTVTGKLVISSTSEINNAEIRFNSISIEPGAVLNNCKLVMIKNGENDAISEHAQS